VWEPAVTGGMASILVVDDSAVVRRMLGLILGRSGHDVRFAVDGGEGLAAMRTETPDLVITDLEMPVMDGITFVRRLRDDPDGTATPVIMLTASGDMEHHHAIAELAVDGFATKPLQSAEVLSLVSRVLAAPHA
jgi:two-component system chemotaxis response regulator CheY